MKRHAIPLALATLTLVACERDPAAPAHIVTDYATAAVLGFSDWAPAIRVEDIPGTAASFNTGGLDGCPFVARDDRTLFMAAIRPGGLGGIDIWVSRRDRADDPWGEPVNVGAPINSTANDFCPTIARDGHDFFFVSNRDGGCGGSDIYSSRMGVDGSFAQPRNLGCHVNSAADEQSPFPLPEARSGMVLYFSSFRAGGFSAAGDGPVSGDSDIYRAESHGGSFGPAELVPGLNSAAQDAQPNLRRDGLEIFFFSTRSGAQGSDIYSAVRSRPAGPWSDPANLGPAVNTTAAESRPSLSWDGLTLYFGSNRAGAEGTDGQSDIYMSTRTEVKGR